MVDIERAKKSASIVALGLCAYFGVRYYDTIMSMPSPLNILVLVIAVLFLWGVTYYALGIES